MIEETPVIRNVIAGIRPNGRVVFTMKDTWGRPVYSGPEERWPKTDDRYYSRAVPEPCDDSRAPDACRLRYGHMGVCLPTPEQVAKYGPY